MHSEAANVYFSILFSLNLMPQTTRSWQKLKNPCFNAFLIKILIERSGHKHQDPGKSWTKQNFNTILIRKYTKILGKAGKIKISILCKKHFNRKKQPQTPRSWQKLEKSKSQYFFIRILIERCSHKHQDPAKTRKHQNFNTFFIGITMERTKKQPPIERNSHQY